MLSTSVISQKTAQVNNRPLGENLPNLVTLAGYSQCEGRQDKKDRKIN
jgi:hypothetical protein